MAAPTYPAAADLVAGTGTRNFPAVSTQAGDILVVEVIVENNGSETYTPSGGGLTYTLRNDSDFSDLADVRCMQWTAPDPVGGSRTVTITPSAGSRNYRGRLTVVRGSDGVGAAASTRTAQTVSLARQGANSGIFMAVGDWDAGAVGTPVWAPGGATVASQQVAGTATYIFGRWDDSGAQATEAHGIASPSYGTPAVAALELLGTAGGTEITGTAAGSYTLTAAAAGTPTVLGAAVSALGVTATAAGRRQLTGTAAAPLTLSAAASGTVTVAGAAAAPVTLSAAASGLPTVLGTAAAVLGLTATAAGEVPGQVTGTAGAMFSFTATATGRVALITGVEATGTATGLVEATGAAAGRIGG